jgi:hypothetical protein
MNRNKYALALAVLLGAAGILAAQQPPGTIASLEFQTPKNGMVKQYEDGRKQKAEWHKQQKDPLPLMVWAITSGDQTGTYVVGRLGQHWADLDKPAIPDQADLDQYNKLIGGSVQSLVIRYYEYLPKQSKPLDVKLPSKFAEIITFYVRSGHEDEFRSALTRASEAIEKTKWPANFEWYVLANGGVSGTYVLVLPHANWADFEDKPGMKPFPEMVREAFGESEGNSILHRFDESVAKQTSEIIEFRPDLSYLPSK